MCSRASLTSWAEDASLALVGDPSSSVTIKLPYGVDVLHRPVCCMENISNMFLSLGRFKYRFIKLYMLIGSDSVHYVIKWITKGKEMLAGVREEAAR